MPELLVELMVNKLAGTAVFSAEQVLAETTTTPKTILVSSFPLCLTTPILPNAGAVTGLVTHGNSTGSSPLHIALCFRTVSQSNAHLCAAAKSHVGNFLPLAHPCASKHADKREDDPYHRRAHDGGCCLHLGQQLMPAAKNEDTHSGCRGSGQQCVNTCVHMLFACAWWRVSAQFFHLLFTR